MHAGTGQYRADRHIAGHFAPATTFDEVEEDRLVNGLRGVADGRRLWDSSPRRRRATRTGGVPGGTRRPGRGETRSRAFLRRSRRLFRCSCRGWNSLPSKTAARQGIAENFWFSTAPPALAQEAPATKSFKGCCSRPVRPSRAAACGGPSGRRISPIAAHCVVRASA